MGIQRTLNRSREIQNVLAIVPICFYLNRNPIRTKGNDTIIKLIQTLARILEIVATHHQHQVYITLTINVRIHHTTHGCTNTVLKNIYILLTEKCLVHFRRTVAIMNTLLHLGRCHARLGCK